MRSTLSILITLLILSCPSSSLFAQSDEDTTVYAWGIVESFAQDSIVLNVYDEATQAESQVTYPVASDVTLENLGSMEELQPNDVVDLELEQKEGTLTVINISVDTSVSLAADEEPLEEMDLDMDMPDEVPMDEVANEIPEKQ